ncbi:unnamed protein product, partial [marine sediment metagenome]
AGTLMENNPFLQMPLQSQLFAKLMNKKDPSKVSEMAFSHGDV